MLSVADYNTRAIKEIIPAERSGLVELAKRISPVPA